jgi:hypothetical protein
MIRGSARGHAIHTGFTRSEFQLIFALALLTPPIKFHQRRCRAIQEHCLPVPDTGASFLTAHVTVCPYLCP